MLTSDLFEEAVIDFDPKVTRDLFDLDLAANQNKLEPKQLRQFKSFLYQHRFDSIRLYHATSITHDVMNKGLLPTSTTRRRSMQSGSGYVYLSYDPMRALSFATFGYPVEKQFVVYAVTVLIRKLKADVDQLHNKRMWGERPDIGGSLADSLILGGGARVKGRIEPWQISVYGYFDKNGHAVSVES